MKKDNSPEATQEEANKKKTKLEKKIDSLKQEVAELNESVAQEKESKLMRLADFQNYKKRIEQEKIEWMNMSSKALILQLIEIIDDFNRAKNNDSEDKDKLIAGYELITEKIGQILVNQGAEIIDIKIGDEFDPKYMEALTTVPVENKKDNNKVVHIEEAGYNNKHKNQVLKMAKVVIGKK